MESGLRCKEQVGCEDALKGHKLFETVQTAKGGVDE